MIVSLFFFLSLASIVLIPHLPIGLDESLALPSDSHVKLYFDDIFKYLNIGEQV